MTVHIERDVPLAQFTTIGIGGPARYFVRVSDVDALREALDWAARESQPVFILGGGSNLLISDDGFPGIVIQNDLRGIVVQAEDENVVIVRANAGEPWDDFVARTVRNGWAGVECLSGIPGLVGATPIQNVGAYGQDVSETIIRVEVLDRTDGRVKTLTNWDCRFGYRSSLFKNYERERYVVTGVTFQLRRNGSATVKYPELQRYLDEHSISLDDLLGVRGAVIAIRKRKGMVLDASDPDTRSDGSFFMNPIVAAATADALASRYAGMPAFPAGDGTVKLSAAWLIEHAGFTKGFTLGNAGLSTKHTLAVVNRGGASAADVIALVEMVQSKVRAAFGVELHPEPNFIGFDQTDAR